MGTDIPPVSFSSSAFRSSVEEDNFVQYSCESWYVGPCHHCM